MPAITTPSRTVISRAAARLLYCCAGLMAAGPAPADDASPSERQRFISPAAAPNDGFGTTIVLADDGATLLFGVPAAPCATNALQPCGAVHVFAKRNGLWRLEQTLRAPDAVPGDGFGLAAALTANGNTALIGAPFRNCADGSADCGATYVFTRYNANWSPGRILTASNGGANDRFGATLDLSANGATALIGAPLARCVTLSSANCGAAYAFVQQAGEWSQQQELSASGSSTGGGFGTSLALSTDGRTALVGAPATACEGSQGTANCGAAYVYISDSVAWTAQQKLVPTDAASDLFGASVALSGNGATALIGAPAKDCTAPLLKDCGAAYVFTRYLGQWTQSAEFTPPGPQGANLAFGTTVGLDDSGKTALIAAPGDLCGTSPATPCLTAYDFERYASGWTERARLLPKEPLTLGALTQFGRPLALAKDAGLVLLRSQIGTTTAGEAPTGAVSVFALSRNLAISQVYAPNPATVGTSLTVSLTVTNFTHDRAAAVVLKDTLPAALALESAAAGCQAQGRQVTCQLGALAAGASAETVLVVTPRAPGTFPNKLTVTSPGLPALTRTQRITVAANLSGIADLAVAKTASKSAVRVGQRLNYTLKATNHGPSDAKGVVLSDLLPAGLSLVSAGQCSVSGTQIECRLGRLRPTQTVSRRIVVRADTAGELVNTAAVSGATKDPKPANDSATATVRVTP